MKVARIPSSLGLNDRLDGGDLTSLLITTKANINEQIAERRAATARPVPLSVAEKYICINTLLKNFNENRARSKLVSEAAATSTTTRRAKTPSAVILPSHQSPTLTSPTLSASLRARKSAKSVKSAGPVTVPRQVATAGPRRPSVVSTSESNSSRPKRESSRKNSVDHSVSSYYTHPESSAFSNDLISSNYDYEDEDDNVFEESQTIESGKHAISHGKGLKYSSPSLATINELQTTSTNSAIANNASNPLAARKFSNPNNNANKPDANGFSNARTSIELIHVPQHLQGNRHSTSSYLNAPVRTLSISQSGAGIAANQRASIVSLSKRRASKPGLGFTNTSEDFFSGQQATQQRPKLPRIVANMSKEFRYAMLKSYEDLMYVELARTFPDAVGQLPRTPTVSMPSSGRISLSAHLNRDSAASPVSRHSNNSNLSNYTAASNKLNSTDSDGSKHSGNSELEEDLEEHNKRIRASALIESAMKILDEIKSYQQSGKQRRSPSTTSAAASAATASPAGGYGGRKASVSIDHDALMGNTTSYKPQNLTSIRRLRQGSVSQQIVEEDPLTMYKRWVEACTREIQGSDL